MSQLHQKFVNFHKICLNYYTTSSTILKPSIPICISNIISMSVWFDEGFRKNTQNNYFIKFKKQFFDTKD